MDVKVNDKTFKCHLYLGSQCSLMRETDAKLLDVNMIKNAELPNLRGIGANLVRPLGLIIATVEVQDIKEVVDIYVVQDYILRYPLLLGHSFSEKLDIVITKTPDKIIFQKIQHQKVHLISQNRLIIPINSLLHCESLNKGYAYVSGST
ncbi:unnamed protein product [Parnassius mnemosyne]|uniref:Uncharacterized protein n=1 Tax=Parnassius mnemosyne TaxID=213953 RepID=A0AAV1KUD0_9NEOP